jgi:hypothetical protein
MTAYRIVEDHNELTNVGETTHDQIDSHINTTPFVVVSGTVGSVPANARYLSGSGGVAIIDNGPGGPLVISTDGGVAPFVFPNDLTVSLPGGKTFGRFGTGETIPAAGKTPAEVILLAISEPIDPTVTLTAANILTSAFNTTGFVSTSLTGSYVINSAGASVASATLQFRSGNVGPWTTIATSTAQPLLYDHVFSVGDFFSQTLNYQYTVVDTKGATTVDSFDLIPQAYSSPTTSLTVNTTSPTGIVGETNIKREIGNVGSTISGTITRNRINVPIVEYSVQYSTNGSTWSGIPGLTAVTVVGNPASVSIPSTSHNDPALELYTTLYYRVQVTDIYQTTNSSTTTISFVKTIFYGPSAAAPTTSADIRGLDSKVFVNSSNPFNLNTGNTQRHFVVALPSSVFITEVMDLDALNANITANYALSSIDVEDAGGITSNYNVYTMTNAIPYTANHRHRITRA